MKKFLIGVAIALSMTIASVVTVNAAREYTASNQVEMTQAVSSANCTGPKSGGECRCENARSCGDNTGCGGGGITFTDVIKVLCPITNLFL